MSNSVTFADLQALAIDTDTLPPMRDGNRNAGRKSDRKRSADAKRIDRARRQARDLKHRELVSA